MVDNKHSSETLSIFGVDSMEHVPKEYIDNRTIWVFGYGSILWKTGFKYQTKKPGYIQGFVRRFWQGNTTHRGTTNKVRFALNYFFHCISSISCTYRQNVKYSNLLQKRGKGKTYIL